MVRQSKESIDIGIIGPGDLGRQSAIKLFDLEEELAYRIGKIYLIGRNREKTEKAVDQVSQAITPKVRSITPWHSSELEELLDSVCIFLITADANRELWEKAKADKKVIDREELTRNNIPLIQGFANQFNRDYNGIVVIASNLTDILSYVFASYVGMDPTRVIGLNQLDTVRLCERIIDFFKRDNKFSSDINKVDIRSFAIGRHDNPYCVFNRVRYSGLDISHYFIGSDGKRTFEAHTIDEKVRKDGRGQMQALGSTNPSTARAVFETIKAIMDEETRVTASVYLPEKGVFIGLPVYFRDFKAVIDREWFEDVPTDDDYREFDQRVNSLKEDLGKLGIKSLPSTQREEKPIEVTERAITKPSIYAATEQQHEVLIWFPGNYDNHLKIKCRMEGEERSVFDVKVRNFDGKPYLLASTFNGVFAQGLENPEGTREFLIKNASSSQGIIRSIDTVVNTIYGAHSIRKKDRTLGYGLFKWSFDKEGYGILFKEPVRMLQSKEGVVYFSSDNKLYVLEDGRIREECMHDNFITYFYVGDFLIIGDTDGSIRLVGDSFKDRSKPLKANTNNYSISSIGYWNINGETYIFVGDEQGFVRCYSSGLNEMFAHWVGKREERAHRVIQALGLTHIDDKPKLLVAVSNSLQEYDFDALCNIKNLDELYRTGKKYRGSNHRVFSVEVT